MFELFELFGYIKIALALSTVYMAFQCRSRVKFIGGRGGGTSRAPKARDSKGSAGMLPWEIFKSGVPP